MRSEIVFDTKHGLAESMALHQPVSLKLPQLRCENFLGCFRNATLQFTKPTAAVLQFAKDQRLPFASDNPESGRYWTLLMQHGNQSTRPSTGWTGTFLCLIEEALRWAHHGVMNILVIGFGNVGSQMGRLWAAKGHTVTAGLREGGNGTERAKQLGVAISEPAAGVKAADVIALALPWQAVEGTLASLGPLDGKIVLDATNPLREDLSVIVPASGSAGEQIARWAKGARVVKAFNTIGAPLFGDSQFDMFYCGDDEEAKNVVRGLIEDTTMRPVDVGPLKNAAYLEHIAGLWIDLAVMGRIQGKFGFMLVKK